MIYVVDTQALVWHVIGSPRLSQSAKKVLDNPGGGNRLAVPAIVLAEAWDLDRKGRRQPAPWSQIEAVLKARKVVVGEINISVIRQMRWADTRLQKHNYRWSDIHDLIILATALDLQGRYGSATIISSDQKLRLEQNFIPCVW